MADNYRYFYDPATGRLAATEFRVDRNYTNANIPLGQLYSNQAVYLTSGFSGSGEWESQKLVDGTLTYDPTLERRDFNNARANMNYPPTDNTQFVNFLKVVYQWRVTLS